MATNLVSNPYSYYADPTRGRPLWDAYVYVGEPDLDPESFPKSLVYIQEDGTEVPAPNPVRTGKGGIFVYNGKPVQIGVDGDYSVRVRDNKGAQVYYIPNFIASGNATVDYVQQQAHAGDSQLADGAIWPVSSQESAKNGDQITSEIRYLRDLISGGIYSFTPLATGELQSFNPSSLTAVIGVTSVSLKKQSNILGSPSDAGSINSTVTTEKIDADFKYSIIPNSAVIGDGDILIDRVDGLQAEMKISGAIDIKAFWRSGRTEQQIIQAALDYATSRSGNWVVAMTPKRDLTPWEFTNLLIGSQTVLQHHGGRMRFADNTAIDNGIQYFPIRANGDEIWMDGLYIDGNGANNSQFVVCDTITIGGNQNKVTNCWLFDAPDSGVFWSDNIDGILKGNHIIGGRDSGIYANGNFEGTSLGTVISDNIIDGHDVAGLSFKRFFSECIADNNQIRNCGNGVTFEDFGGNSFPKRIQLSNTQLKDIGYTKRGAGIAERGISVSKTFGSTITNTTATNVSGDVFYVGDADSSSFITARLRGYKADPSAGGNNGLRVIKMRGGVIRDFDVDGVDDRAGYLSDVVGTSVIGGSYVSDVLSGMRVDANCQFDDFSPNVLNGLTADLEWFAGATGRAKNFTQANATGPAKNGYQVLTAGAGADPNGIILPRFIGETVFTLLDNAIWRSAGLTNTDWKKVSN